MGVLNVTPDSFSDGGDYLDPSVAIAHGEAMATAGADLIDVGGESTRPGADPVAEADEIDRILPVVSALAARGLAVSVDTSKPAVAEAALAAGAEVINDVTAFGTPGMAATAAAAGAGVVLMHMRGTPRTMQVDPRYDNVVGDVCDFLLGRAAMAAEAGVDPDRICLDPGIGFGKTSAHNLLLLRNLGTFAATGYPILAGTSRKSFLGTLFPGSLPSGRDTATAATVALGVAAGAAVFRVHNVPAAVAAARTADAIVRA
jgi:dihydropteroate synthase